MTASSYGFMCSRTSTGVTASSCGSGMDVMVGGARSLVSGRAGAGAGTCIGMARVVEMDIGAVGASRITGPGGRVGHGWLSGRGRRHFACSRNLYVENSKDALEEDAIHSDGVSDL